MFGTVVDQRGEVSLRRRCSLWRPPLRERSARRSRAIFGPQLALCLHWRRGACRSAAEPVRTQLSLCTTCSLCRDGLLGHVRQRRRCSLWRAFRSCSQQSSDARAYIGGGHLLGNALRAGFSASLRCVRTFELHRRLREKNKHTDNDDGDDSTTRRKILIMMQNPRGGPSSRDRD